MLRSLLACGGRVLVHCKGGLGRAGTVSARLLVEGDRAPGDAIQAVRAVRPGAIETRPQEVWVRAGRAVPLVPPARNRDAARDRAVGALLGLAVGDAVGAAIEFSPKPHFAVLDDMAQGGPVTAKLCRMATLHETRDLLRVPVPISSRTRLCGTTHQMCRAAKCQKT